MELSNIKKVLALLGGVLFVFSITLVLMGTISTFLYFPNQEKVELWKNSVFMIENHTGVFLVITLLLLFVISLFRINQPSDKEYY